MLYSTHTPKSLPVYQVSLALYPVVCTATEDLMLSCRQHHVAPSSSTVSDIPPVAAHERVCFDKSSAWPRLAVGDASLSVADVVL